MRYATLAILVSLSLLPADPGSSEAGPLPSTPELCPRDAEAVDVGGVAACRQEVTFASGTLALAGRWLAPRGDGPFPALVVIHGSGESSRGNPWTESLAAVALEERIGVLLPDKRGSGRSEGDWREAGFVELAEDALAGVRYLASRADVAKGRIGLMGLSQGGMIAPVAAARSDSVAFVINVVGSGLPLMESVRYEMVRTFREEGLSGERMDAATDLLEAAAAHVRGELDWAGYERAVERHRPTLGPTLVEAYFLTSPDHWRWGYFRRLADFDAMDWWRKVRQPTLVLLGEADSNTPTAASARRFRSVFSETGHSGARVVVFPELGHSLWDMRGPPSRHGLNRRVRRTLTAWLRSHAKGREG